MALTVDGHAVAGGAFGVATSGTITLTTTLANDLILLFWAGETTASPHRTGSTVTASGLTFTKRGSLYVDNMTNAPFGAAWCSLEVWSAPATAALTAKVITVNLSGAVDTGVIQAFGVNLDGVSIPVWSGNGSLPATNSSTSVTASTPTVAGVSTNAAAMVLGFAMNASTTAFATGGSGYTIIDHVEDGGGTLATASGAEDQVFGTTQSSISVAFGSTAQTWLMIADAIEAPSGGDTFANTGQIHFI